MREVTKRGVRAPARELELPIATTVPVPKKLSSPFTVSKEIGPTSYPQFHDDGKESAALYCTDRCSVCSVVIKRCFNNV